MNSSILAPSPQDQDAEVGHMGDAQLTRGGKTLFRVSSSEEGCKDKMSLVFKPLPVREKTKSGCALEGISGPSGLEPDSCVPKEIASVSVSY